MAKAHRVVQMFMSGAASQVDTFDYKPELIKRHGQPFNPGGKVRAVPERSRRVHEKPVGMEAVRPMRKVRQRLGSHLAGCVDDMAFLHSMVSKSNVHGPATFMQNTGFVLPAFPAWARGSATALAVER